jgi:hypothetical protein
MITTFKSLIAAFLKGWIAGLVSTLISYFLFFDFYSTCDFHVFEVIGMIFFTAMLSFAFCGIVLFPISILETEKSKNLTADASFRHYLPFITLPLFIVFCFLVFTHNESRLYQESEYYFCLKTIITAFCIGTTGLWTFIKNKKS